MPVVGRAAPVIVSSLLIAAACAGAPASPEDSGPAEATGDTEAESEAGASSDEAGESSTGSETRGDGDGDSSTGDGDATTGDGDGDTTTGDGDGDATTGDGDGDATTGDGDGDATTGDGDGDATTGDGDGDATTGDGDGGALEPGPSLGAVYHTYYWVSVEDNFSGDPTAPIYDWQTCDVIAWVKPDFAAAVSIEGTGLLSDGRMINLYGDCGCPSGTCFFEVDEDHPWGYGIDGRVLKPFRSIAVDTSVFTIGDAYYLPAFDGLTMPGDPSYGDFVHDGCVLADDIGGAIQGAHIDFFAALHEHYVELVQSTGSGDIDIYEGGERCAWLADP